MIRRKRGWPARMARKGKKRSKGFKRERGYGSSGDSSSSVGVTTVTACALSIVKISTEQVVEVHTKGRVEVVEAMEVCAKSEIGSDGCGQHYCEGF